MSEIRLAASNIGWKKEDDERIFARMQALGYQGLEIAPTRIFPDRPYERPEGIALFAGYLYQQYGMVIPSMQSILNGKSENLFDAAGRKALLDYLGQAYRFAAACRCKSLVFGCPRNRQLPDGLDVTAADGFFLEAAFLAAQNGVTLALEPVPPCYNTNFLNTALDTCRYVKRLGAPGLAVNLDIGAILTNGEKLADILPYLDKVSHIHISEPGLAPITPRPIHKELALVLKGLGYKGFVSIEMKTTDADTMEAALEYVAEVFA